MKLTLLTLLFASFLLAHANVAWYSPERNATCTGHSDGHISCTPGHIDNVPEVSAPESDTTPAIRGRTPSELEKRVTCNIDGVTQGLACFTHCFAINYCNSHCDAKNICHCSCFDVSKPAILVCSKTTCA